MASDLVPNGILARRNGERDTKQRKNKKTPDPRTDDTGTTLNAVPTNLFYASSSSSSPRAHTPNRPSKRKTPEEPENDSNAGVPWMLGRPINSCKASVAGYFTGREEQNGKRRRVMGDLHTNTPGRTTATTTTKIKREETEPDNWMEISPWKDKKRSIPLFMPSPSPTKPSPRESSTRMTKPAVSEEQAKEMMRDLLLGLDDDLELFDDDLEVDIVKDEQPFKRESDAVQLEKRGDKLEGENESLELHEWMKPCPESGSSATAHGPPNPGNEAKTEPPRATDTSDNESEFAVDEFDYDTIDLDVLVATTEQLSTLADETTTPLHDTKIRKEPSLAGKYPIPNPPVHETSLGKGSPYTPLPWRRCLVESVSSPPSSAATGQRFANQTTKVLECRIVESVAAAASQISSGIDECTSGCRKVRCLLVGEWADLVLTTGDIVNIISPELTVDRLALPLTGRLSSTSSSDSEVLELTFSYTTPSNYLITHPDILFPMTALAGAVGCRRKPLVMDLVKGSNAGNASSKPLLYGNILHELLQTTLQTREFSIRALKACLDGLLRKPGFQLDIWSCGLGMEEVRGEVWEKAVQSLVGFGEKWVGAEPDDTATLHDSMDRLAITGLHDIEESIWSPKWGLKGKVDASVHAMIKQAKGKPRDSKRAVAASAEDYGVPMPFEIKTGRAIGVMEHRAQTMLYTLLMEERYRTPIKSGLLYYTQTDSILEVPAATGEIRSLLMSRNEMAGYAARKRVRQERLNIGRESQLSQARVQVGNAGPSLPLHSEKVEEPVEALQGDADVDDEDDEFSHLDDVLPNLAEAGEPSAMRLRATGIALAADVEELPILPPTIDNERECSRCYASDACMLYRRAADNIDPCTEDPIADLYGRKTGHLTPTDINFFTHWEELISIEEQDIMRFKKQLWTMTAAQREKSGRCFANMKIVKHVDEDGIILAKIHKHSYTFARATKDSSSSSFLNGHIGKNDPISLSIEPDFLAIARGFVLGLTPTEVIVGTNQEINVQALLARSGRDPSTPIVWRIDKDEMLAGTGKMRNNVAQLFFADDAGGDRKRRELIVHLQPPRFEDAWAPNEEEIPDHLNPDQRVAMQKVLTAKDYALILGMPGTGKTTTIAEIILALVKRGKSVLLTSYTHSAVDTILMKLVNSDHRILRLGNADKVHPDVRHLSLDALGTVDSLSQLEDQLMAPEIVATTCLSIDHPLFSRRKFDYCIVDEASQITLPTCIGPLRFADTFVLVGDHFQLPPIVKNTEARRGGLDVSLFKLLSDHHTEAVVDLSYQYRMNADIMSLSNTLIYNNRLKCGSDTIASQTLELPNNNDSHGCQDKCWISQTLQPSVKTIFLNTDKVAARESRAGDLVYNQVEAVLVQQIAAELVARGIHEEQIGVITPYRQQIKILSAMLQDMKAIEVLTADKSQGRDKDCIIISLVRCNDTGSIGELLRDWRRINVSFTRAKKKLIIIGSKSTLSADDRLLSDFFCLMQEKKWILDLPQGAHTLHAEDPGKASDTTPESKVKKQRSPKSSGITKLSDSLIDAKPFIRDILNDVKQE